MDALTLIIVGALIASTLAITAYASRVNKDAGDHYVAGRRIGGVVNGFALAGDQISAASFLGVVGAVALGGFNGFYLAIGIPVAYLLTLLLIAEPLRNLGRYTLADAVNARFESRGLRAGIASSTLVMTVIYMVLQFIGAGLIAGLLLDVSFGLAVVVLGVLMILYTVLGGMVATTYIQVFKTALLATMVLAVFVVAISRTGWNPIGPMIDATDNFGPKVITPDRSDATANFNNISQCIGLALGIMGLPHVMLRFLTVRDARAVRTSSVVSNAIFSVFFLMLPIFGYAALNEVGRGADRRRQPGRQRRRAAAGGGDRRRPAVRAGRRHHDRDDPRRHGGAGHRGLGRRRARPLHDRAQARRRHPAPAADRGPAGGRRGWRSSRS